MEGKKKCVPLQSRYETRASEKNLSEWQGVRKRAPEGAEYDGVHWKDWKIKYKEASTKKHKKRIESVDFFKGIESAGLNLKDKKYTKKSLILAQDER